MGCGRWGRHILRDLVALGSDVTVVARSPETRQRAAAGGAAAIVGTVDELSGVAGIVVATPTSTHADVVAAALDLDVPVFVEKPLTDDPVSARLLCARAPERLFVMEKWRYHPGIEAMAAMRSSGEFGRLRTIHSTRLSWGHDHDDVDGIWILLPHDLSIIREIAGRLPSAIAAVGHVSSPQDAHLIGLLGPDPFAMVEASSISLVRERRVIAEFEEAVVMLADSMAAGLQVRRIATGEESFVPLPADMPLEKELRAFVGFLRGGAPPRSSAPEATETVERISELRALAGIR